jgi:hypothetical protein
LFNTTPALFVENQGQWADESIRFAHSGNGVNVGMTDMGIAFQLIRHEPSTGADAGGFSSGTTSTRTFSSSFLGANTVNPVGLDQSQTLINYLLGDSSTWQSDVPTFEKVGYTDLYAGIDLVTWGLRSHLKYEFHVAPGSDYQQIQIQYDGIGGLSIAEDGSLVVDLGDEWGSLVDAAPIIYQEINGARTEVAGQFVLIDGHTYGFEISGPYDPACELIIDPNLDWSTYFGGSANEFGFAITVDNSGNTFVTGETTSPGWVSGGFDVTPSGVDAFVMKVDPAGSHVWSTYLGGSGLDAGYGIAIDPSGNPLVTGRAGSTGWVSGGYDTSYGGSFDGFVAKLSPTGGHIWSTYLGAGNDDTAYGIAIDATGNALVTGYSQSGGWVSGGFDTSHGGTAAYDGFVVKLNSAGAHLWSTYLGSGGYDLGEGIAIDASGNAFIVGYTESSGWVSGGFDTSYNGGSFDAFVVALGGTGAHVWSTYLGGSGDDRGYGIAIDAAGNAYLTGETASSGWVTGGFDTSFNGGVDAFVAKLTLTGSHVWSSFLGGGGSDPGFHIAVDASGGALLTGYTNSSGWTSGGFDTSYNGGSLDAYVANLSASGGHVWSSYLGGSGDDRGFGIAADASGNAYVAGYTRSAGWVSGGFDTSYNGGEDGFVAKISIVPPNVAPVAVDNAYSTNEDVPLSVGTPGVLGNDADADGDPLTAILVAGPMMALAFNFNPDGSFSYTPAANFNGVDSFTYKANDGQADSNVATATITVNSVNDAPIAADDSYSTDEDVTLNGASVLANDSDLHGGAPNENNAPLTAQLVSGPANASFFTLNADGTFTYAPNSDFNGSDSFTYQAFDSLGAASNTATVTITVNAANDAPVAADDSDSVAEDGSVTTAVLANDIAGPANEDQTLTVVAVTQGANGTVTTDGTTVTYTANANFFGSDSYTYTIEDSDGATDTATVSITVSSVNDDPDAVDDADSVVEDGSVTTAVLANDNAGPGNEDQTLAVSAVTQGANGTVTTDGTTVTYTPNPDFFGSDSYTYTIEDSDGATDTATVSITVTSVNDDPDAVDDSDSVAEDGSVTTNVLANDNAGPGNEDQTLVVVAVTQGANGSATTDGTTVTYTPNPNFFGSDNYTYTIEDSDGGSDTATVTITVTSVNDDPDAVDDSDSVAEDGSVTTAVLANDNAGPGNEDQTLVVVAVTQGANGSVTTDGTTVTYTPNPNFFGSDSYTYTIEDSDGATDTATVTITVNEVNDDPVAVNDSASTTQDVPVSGNVLANDTDPDNTDGYPGNEDDLDAVLVSGPSSGTLVLDSETGAFTYTPNTGFFGTDSFTYQAVDSDGALSNIATVTITVAAAPPGSVYLIPDACYPGELALVVNGSSGDDTIHITPTTDGLSVTVNGVSQTFNPTGRIIVFAYGGADWVQSAGAISNQTWLYGDDGNDYLNIGNGGGIAFGGAGDDYLLGGNSRDILVGGDGADRLVGNSGDDLMIASSSIYDDRFTRLDHEAAWCAIYHEWSRTDHTYQQRVDNIFDGSGTVDRDNGPYFLNTSTVTDDNDEDKLTGSAALDWFFANLAGPGVRDTVTDLKSSEVAEDV